MKIRRIFFMAGGLFVLFLLLMALVLKVDVQPIGPEQSSVGLASVNQWVHQTVGVHLIWYVITDWLGLSALAVAMGFAALGLIQLIQRKSLRKVDQDILLLGLLYIAVMAVYACFECFVVNWRPVLLNGNLEASFPSSHTMIVFCIMATAMLQFQKRISNEKWKKQ